MSSTTNKQPENNDLAAKMMLGARRLGQPPAAVMQSVTVTDTTVAATPIRAHEPVMAKSIASPINLEASEISAVDEVPARRTTRRPREAASSENHVAADISVDPGKATCTLSVRVPRKLRAELNLLAMQARYGGADGPATVNDLVLEAVETFLRDRRQNRAA